MPRKKRKRTYGTGSVVPRGKGWQIRYRENGAQRTRTFADPDVAERVLKKTLGEIADGESGLRRDPKAAPTLSELFKPWIAGREHKHKSWKNDRSCWNQVGAHFGRTRPAGVTAEEIAKFVDASLATGLSSSTVGNRVRLLSTFLADVVENPANGLTINPVRTVRRATRKKYRTAKFDAPFVEKREDIRRLFLALPEPYNVMYACGVMLGLRTAEVIGLAWKHIDMVTRRVRISQQVQEGRITSLKDEDPRTVPIQATSCPS